MPEIAADATVLIFLGKLRRLDLLREHYDEVIIPQEVYEEVIEQGKAIGEEDAILVENALDEGWISVEDVRIRDEIDRFDLESGETAVLSIALARNHDEVLADEESVREIARLFDLRPRGTLAFLLAGVRDGQFTFDQFVESLERLLEIGFCVDEAVYLEAVRRARNLEKG